MNQIVSCKRDICCYKNPLKKFSLIRKLSETWCLHDGIDELFGGFSRGHLAAQWCYCMARNTFLVVLFIKRDSDLLDKLYQLVEQGTVSWGYSSAY